MANIAVINLAGAQHIVRPGDKLEVNRLVNNVDEIFNPDVLLSMDGDNVLFASGKVEARVIGHIKGEKLHVIKFRAKSRYRRKTGHRQSLTLLEIVSVNGEKRSTKKAEPKPETVNAETVAPKKVSAKKTAAKKSTKKEDK
jgi:large subunit ribosomal protein L21